MRLSAAALIFIACLQLTLCKSIVTKTEQPRHHDVAERSVDPFNVVIAFGKAAQEALDLYSKIKGSFAKIFINVINYSRWPMVKRLGMVSQGITITQYPQIIWPGDDECLATREQLYDAGTEGTVAWQIADRLYFVHWHASQEGSRTPNHLAIGSIPYMDSLTMRFILGKVVEDAKPPSCKQSNNTKYQEYDVDQPTITFCDDVVCIQGDMTSSHECQADINVFPVNATNIAPSLSSKIDQSAIDSKRGEDFISGLGCNIKTKRHTLTLSGWLGLTIPLGGLGLLVVAALVRRLAQVCLCKIKIDKTTKRTVSWKQCSFFDCKSCWDVDDDVKHSNGKPSGDETSGDKTSDDKPSDDKTSGDRTSDDKTSDDKTSDDKTSGDKTSLLPNEQLPSIL